MGGCDPIEDRCRAQVKPSLHLAIAPIYLEQHRAAFPVKGRILLEGKFLGIDQVQVLGVGCLLEDFLRPDDIQPVLAQQHGTHKDRDFHPPSFTVIVTSLIKVVFINGRPLIVLSHATESVETFFIVTKDSARRRFLACLIVTGPT